MTDPSDLTKSQGLDAAVDAVWAELTSAGVTITERMEPIVAEYRAEVERAAKRLEQRLIAAVRACEAIDDHHGRPRPCQRLGILMRDGRKVCERHERGPWSGVYVDGPPKRRTQNS